MSSPNLVANFLNPPRASSALPATTPSRRDTSSILLVAALISAFAKLFSVRKFVTSPLTLIVSALFAAVSNSTLAALLSTAETLALSSLLS